MRGECIIPRKHTLTPVQIALVLYGTENEPPSTALQPCDIDSGVYTCNPLRFSLIPTNTRVDSIEGGGR